MASSVHGGSIRARNGNGGGLEMEISLPIQHFASTQSEI
jgi:hypothetical protein